MMEKSAALFSAKAVKRTCRSGSLSWLMPFALRNSSLDRPGAPNSRP